MNFRVQPQLSPVHGNGLFAVEPIPAGSILLQFDGTNMRHTDEISDAIIAEGHWQGIAPGLALFPNSDKRSLFSYINHSKHPNAFVDLRSEEHTSELQSLRHLVCRLL